MAEIAGTDKWLGQPYFLEPLHEASASTIMANTGTIRRNFEDSCIVNEL